MKKTLEEISVIRGEYGGGFSAIELNGNSPRYVRITDITNDGKLTTNSKGPSGKPSEWEKYKLEEGDLLFARSGATVGKTFLYTKRYGECIFAGYLIRFRIDPNIAYPKYIYYYTKSPNYYSWVSNKQKVVAQPNINAKQYGQELKIPLPPLEEQKRIAAILDAADEYRQKTRALIDKYDELAQSLFLEMFGDPVTNPKGWEKVSLKKLCDFSKDSIKPEEIKSNTNYIGLESIEKVTGNIQNLAIVNRGDIKSTKFRFDPNHILYGKLRPYLNKVATPEFDGICSTDIIPIKPIKNKTYKEFIVSVLKGSWFVAFANEKSSGANLPRISPSIVKEYNAINPPLNLQELFAKRISLIKTQKSSAVKCIEKSDQLFNSLLQRAFKGEL